MSKRILTWIKPTDSQIHLGNYFWAVVPFLRMAKENPDAEIFMFLANMHALTALHDWNAIRNNSINIVKLYAACGADLNRFYIYNPADIPAHAQVNYGKNAFIQRSSSKMKYMNHQCLNFLLSNFNGCWYLNLRCWLRSSW